MNTRKIICVMLILIAAVAVATAATYTYKCPGCGAILTFDRITTGIKCPKDGMVFVPVR